MPSRSHQFLIFMIALVLVSAMPSNIDVKEHVLTFNIVHKDKVIGNLTATKTISDATIRYKSITAIKTRIIKEIEVDYKYDVLYENERLKKSSVVIDVNDKPYADIITHKEQNTYQIIKNSKKEKTVEGDIDYATILLYFKEPIGVDRCFSEQDGSFNSIVSLGNHVYKKINAKNHENVYYYTDGFLQKAEINGGLIKFELIAQN